VSVDTCRAYEAVGDLPVRRLLLGDVGATPACALHIHVGMPDDDAIKTTLTLAPPRAADT